MIKVRFERQKYTLDELVRIMEKNGILWGRDFSVLGFRKTDYFELGFKDDSVATRAYGAWNERLRPYGWSLATVERGSPAPPA